MKNVEKKKTSDYTFRSAHVSEGTIFNGHSFQNKTNSLLIYWTFFIKIIKKTFIIIQNNKTLLEANLSASLLHDNSTTYNPLSSY